MNKEERLRTIDKLKGEIAVINERKIMLALIIDYSKDKTDIEIAALKKELNLVNTELDTLMQQLRPLQVLYEISYTAQIIDSSDAKQAHDYVEYYYLQSDCDIDTKLYGWERYVSNVDVNQLLQEIHNTISTLRCSNFVITGVKRL